MGGKVRLLRLTQWLERTGPLVWQLGTSGIGFVLAAGSVFGGLHPFGMALVMGAGSGSLFSTAAGAMLGYFVFLPLSESLRYLAAIAVILAGRIMFREQFLPGAVGGCGTLIVVQLMLSMGGLSSVPQAFATVGVSVLAVSVGYALYRCGNRELHGAPLGMGALLLYTSALPGLQQIALGPLLPGVVMLAAGGLALAYRGRLRDCMVFCVCGATVLSACDPNLSFAGLAVAAGCLAAAYFTPGERMGSATMFLVGAILGALSAPDSSMILAFLTSCVLGEAVFFVIPQRLLMTLPGQMDITASQRPQVAGAVSQLESVANALTGIADTVNQVYETLPKQGESYNWVIDYVAEELCRRCANRETCWVEAYTTTMDGFYRLKGVLEQYGRAALEQLPGQFCRCIHPTELCSCSSRGYALYRGRRESRVKAGAMRAALTEQYSAMAQALGQMAGQLGQSIAQDVAKTERLSSLFSSIGLEPLECQVGFDNTGRLRASVTVSRTPFEEDELLEITDEAQRILHRPLSLPRVDHCRAITTITFTEQPIYYPQFGLASRSAQEGACGDAVEQFCDCFGNAHLLLCDGMGVGRPAAIDGTLAATLAARLLKAGFCADSAARLVNVALSLKSDEESGATMDLVTVDLYTGRANLFKAGACPTFVVRAGKAHVLDGSSLPVGILEQVVGQQDSTNLHEGEWIVLVSDGVLLDGTGWLCQQLELCCACGNTPQETADIVADMARNRLTNQHPDDVTVAVLSLERAVK